MSSGWSYAPATTPGWIAVAAGGAAILVHSGADPVRMGGALTADDPVTAALEILTEDGIAVAPAFALLVRTPGSLRVIVRGSAEVRVQTDSGDTMLSAHGTTSWLERSIDGAVSAWIETGADASAGPALPLRDGAAWAVRLGLASTDETSTDEASTDETSTDEAITTADATRMDAGTALSSRRAARERGDDDPAPAAATAPALPATPATPVASTPDEPTPAACTDAPPPAPSATPMSADTQVFLTGVPHTSASDPAPPTGENRYDDLFGATVARPVGAAAVLPPEDDDESAPATEAAPETEDRPGDHDGLTIFARDLPRGETATPGGYGLRLPDGSLHPLTIPVIIGRAPSVSHVPASVLPQLIVVEGDDISRSHLRIAIEGGTVVVTDLHSSNGTCVLVEGAAPLTLRPGEPTPLAGAAGLALGDVLLAVEER